MKNYSLSITLFLALINLLFACCKIGDPDDFCKDNFEPAFKYFIDTTLSPASLSLTDTTINASISSTYKWYVDGEEIGSSKDVFYDLCRKGDYKIKLEVSNCSNTTKEITMTVLYTNEKITAIPFNVEGKDIGTKIICTSDGNYAICGISGDSLYVWVDKVTIEGLRLWNKTPIIGLGSGEARDIIELQNGNYLVCGTVKTLNNGNDILIAEFDNISGQMLPYPKTRTYGGADEDRGYSIKQTSDKGFIIAGCSWSEPGAIGNGDMYLLRLNSNRDSIWSKHYGGTGFDCASSVLEKSDGEYIVCGTNDGNAVSYIIKPSNIDDWQQTYPINVPGVLRSIKRTNDENYILAGYTFNGSTGAKEMYVAKINKFGAEINLSQNTFGGPKDVEAYDVIQTSDEGFIIVGYKERADTGKPNAYLVKIDNEGNFIWSPNLETDFFRRAASVVEAPNCELLIFGTTFEAKDFLLLKTIDMKK